MLGCRLYNYTTQKFVDEIAVGDCVIFKLSEQGEHDTKSNTRRSPTFSLVGVVTSLKRSETGRSIMFECQDAFTGNEYQHKMAIFVPCTDKRRKVTIITEQEIANEKFLNEISKATTALRFDDTASVPTYWTEDRTVKVFKHQPDVHSPDCWTVSSDGHFIGYVDSPTDIGWLRNANGLFSGNYTGNYESRWFNYN